MKLYLLMNLSVPVEMLVQEKLTTQLIIITQVDFKYINTQHNQTHKCMLPYKQYQILENSGKL